MVAPNVIAFLGHRGAGKSSLIDQLHGRFNSVYNPTIEDTLQCGFTVDNISYKFTALDTGEFDEQNCAMMDQWIRTGTLFFLVYDTTSPTSFRAVREIWKLVTKHHRREHPWKAIPAFLVANKIDLEEKRQISSQEGFELAAELGIKYAERSVKLSHLGMQQLVVELIDYSLQAQKFNRLERIDQQLPPKTGCLTACKWLCKIYSKLRSLWSCSARNRYRDSSKGQSVELAGPHSELQRQSSIWY